MRTTNIKRELELSVVARQKQKTEKYSNKKPVVISPQKVAKCDFKEKLAHLWLFAAELPGKSSSASLHHHQQRPNFG